MSARTTRLRLVVDAAMAITYLLQMLPGKLGNPLHELAGCLFALLFVAHHVLNWGWMQRLGRQRGLWVRVVMLSDVLLTACVLVTIATGVLMSRTLAPWAAVPAVAHVVRPLHGCSAYLGLMLAALHASLHMRILRGYTGLRAPARQRLPHGIAALALALIPGTWAFMRLGVAGKLAGLPSFPDAMTPLPMQVALHLALALPCVVAGALIDGAPRTRDDSLRTKQKGSADE